MNTIRLTFGAMFVSVGFAALSLAGDAVKSDHQKPHASDTGSTEAELGIGVSPIPPVLTSHLPDVIGKGRGILISHVAEGSPADKPDFLTEDEDALGIGNEWTHFESMSVMRTRLAGDEMLESHCWNIEKQ